MIDFEVVSADIIYKLMKSKAYLIAVLYLVLGVSGSLYGIGEKTIRLTADSIWKMADYKAGLAEMGLVRPAPVLVLSSSGLSSVSSLDMALTFDEGLPSLFRDFAGHYRVSVSPLLVATDDYQARMGFGAALFPDISTVDARPEKASANIPLMMKAQNRAALFAPNNHIYDFSIEFWLHPLNMENGEQILQWVSASPVRNAKANDSQRILCVSAKNRLQWSFSGFFTSPDDAKSIEINLTGHSPVVPKTWSHHQIQFDSITGMVEYLVNGKTETIQYATSTGREGGEVYTPVAGNDGSFVLGGGFSGMMDEFRIYGANAPSPSVRKYPLRGGRLETHALDLGEGSNGVLKVEAFGGKVSVVNEKINNEYRQNGRFRFSDDTEMQFFVRCSNNPYQWNNSWQPVIPGMDITGNIQGRYVQLAVDFYPSSNGEVSPYLEELCLTYLPDEAPLPPAQLTAIAGNGGVQLRWKNSPDQNTQGYLVYYGTSSDDYFGEDAAMGSSPIDVGKQNNIFIEGLKNGTLYYFRVAAYSQKSGGPFSASFHAGEFSREVRARPLQ
jgi:hypothetical protein